jgi:glycine betaine/proline transport system substrate-binding protein
MQKARKSLWLILAVLALVAAACGSDSETSTADDTATTEAPSSDDTTETTAAPVTDDTEAPADTEPDDAMVDSSQIGAGVTVTMARADWASGYIQAEIYHQVLAEMGYDVSNPSELELGPQLAYQQMAEGEIDFWTNSWYPGHVTWWEQETSAGGVTGDNLVKVDGLFANSGVQGWLITKSWVDENNITTMDMINETPELAAALPDTDNDGVGEVFTCQESWTCDDIQENQFVFAGWDNLQPLKAGYDAMFAQFVDLVKAGEPAIIYTWTPASYVTQAIPGIDVYWLSVEESSVLDDSNPKGLEGGEGHAQVGVDDDGPFEPFTGLPPEECTLNSDGNCNLGWNAADIQVTANKAFAEANPNLIAMFEQMRPSVVDISIAQVEQSNGNGSQSDVERISGDWIAANRDIVVGWIAIAAG